MLTERDWAVLARHTEVENAHRLDDTLATLSPDCVFEDVALGTIWRGRAQAAEYYRMWWEGLDVHVDVESVHATGDGTVIAETIWTGRHIGSFLGVEATGRAVELPLVIVAELADGLLARERLYWDRQTVLDQLVPGRAETACVAELPGLRRHREEISAARDQRWSQQARRGS